jgi:hypothetical protein
VTLTPAALCLLSWPRLLEASQEALVRPSWDDGRLCLGGRLVKKVPLRATSQRLLLDAFRDSDWATDVANPFKKGGGKGKRQLRDTVAALNQGQQEARLRFRANGDGGASWEITDATEGN